MARKRRATESRGRKGQVSLTSPHSKGSCVHKHAERVPRDRALAWWSRSSSLLFLALRRASSVAAPGSATAPAMGRLRCFIGSATGAQPQRHGRRIFKKHVSGLDDFEKIPNLNWDKFDKGVQQGQSRWTYALAHHRPGRCGESRTGARVARRLTATECAAVRTHPWARRGDTVHAGARLEHS